MLEALLVAAMGIAALCALVQVRGRPAARAWIGIVGVGACAGAAVYLAPRAPTEQSIETRPIEDADTGYVSSDTCRACHPSQYATWRASYHRSMTRRASRDTVLGAGEVQLAAGGHEFLLGMRGDEVWVAGEALAQLDGNRAAPRRVALVTGSHHEQVLWHETGAGRRLGLFPFVYRIDEARWIPYMAAFVTPNESGWTEIHGSGQWNTGCQRCHTTRTRPGAVAGASAMDTRATEFGIACEACHGPAERHVERHRNPLRRYSQHLSEERDPSIVNPAKLDPGRRSQVCGQCHAVATLTSAEANARYMHEGPAFRPGDELSDTRIVIDPAQRDALSPEVAAMLGAHFFEEQFWPDGMIVVGGREYNALLASPCYAGGEFSCLSCHSLHPPAGDGRDLAAWADDQLAAGMRGDRACLQCHVELGADLEAHTRHPSGSPGSNCYNCHMPYTSYGLMKATRSHQVSSPRVQETLEHRRPNACNLCHLDQTLDWAARSLEAGWGVPQPGAQVDTDYYVTAAGAVWGLSGDAAQRAIAGWHMGWEPARQASGQDWMGPILIRMLDDPYPAVRFRAMRALRTFEGFDGFEYDFVPGPSLRPSAEPGALQRWEAGRTPEKRSDASAVALQGTRSNRARIDRLSAKRDNRRVVLVE